MRLVILSDTHGLHEQVDVPDGDVLVHAGDLSNRGTLDGIRRFDAWISGLPHRHKLVIAGNHDFAFEDDAEAARSCITAATYLQDEGTTIGGVRFWGSPWQPWFFDWAFNLKTPAELAAVWARIPDNTDVLITHGPPRGILDTTSTGKHAGCAELLREVEERVRPKVHAFGHIHEAHGVVERGGTAFVNASTCTLQYRPVHPAIVLDI